MSKEFFIFSILILSLSVASFLLEEKDIVTTDNVAMSFDEFDQIIKLPVSSISPLDLADMLMKQESHYNLIDLRTTSEVYQIPTSEKYSSEEFLNLKLAVNETIIIYSKFEIEAIQLYYLLVARGYFKVKVLVGGMEQWKNQVLHPVRTKIDLADLGFRLKLTTFFGGSLKDSDNSDTTEVVEIPIFLQKKHKKHHGC